MTAHRERGGRDGRPLSGGSCDGAPDADVAEARPDGSRISRRSFLLALPGLAVAGGLTARARPAPLRVQGIHQATLAVSDPERSLAFYQELFGMPVQARRGDSVLLRIGDGPRFMALMPAGPDGPRIDHFGLGVPGFGPERVVEVLSDHGVTRSPGRRGPDVGSMGVRVTRRGRTPEVFLGDPAGLVVQLQDPAYCGGGGRLGDECPAAEPSPAPGSLSLRDLNHLTILVPDPERQRAFYRDAFGLDVQAMQGPTPALGVGPGGHFLMFIGGGASPPPAAIHHVCFTVPDFDLEGVQGVLEDHGIRPRGSGDGPPGPREHWVSMRMPDRGGAPGGTPELYFTDPDGIRLQLQDVSYCGGGGYLGDECP